MKIKIIFYLNVIFLLLPLQAFAAEEKVAAQTLKSTASVINHETVNSSYLLQLIIGLFIVLICIVALAWFTKKINRFKFLTDESLKIIGGLSMGARENCTLTGWTRAAAAWRFTRTHQHAACTRDADRDD